MDQRVKVIVEYLNRARVRATYGAVGEAIGINAQSVGRLLGVRCPRASWVVLKKSGEPSGYMESQKHPDLHHTLEIISSGSDLARRMKAAG